MRLQCLGKREKYFSWLMFVLPTILDFFSVPGQHALVSCIFILIAFVYASDREFHKIVVSFPLIIWLSLTLYHWFNARYKHVVGVDYADLLHGFRVYFCLCIVFLWAMVDIKKTVKMLLSAYLLRCFFVLFLLVLGGYSGGRLTGAGGSATGLGQMAALIGIYIAYANVFRKISIQKNVFYFSLPFLIVILSQSRNSLAMLVISLIACFFSYNGWRKGNANIKFVVCLCGIVTTALFAMPVLEQTSIGQRAAQVSQATEGSYIYRNYATNTIFDKIVGDRLVYYVKGWDFFKGNPMTGIGMWNYRVLTRGQYPLHSEYMVHLCEGGVCAAVLWVIFVGYVLVNLFLMKTDKVAKKVALLSIALLLFCGIYAREFFYEMFYPSYALSLALIKKNRDYERMQPNLNHGKLSAYEKIT